MSTLSYSCRKPYFLRYGQLEVGWVTMYDKGREINTVLNHCKVALDMEICTYIDGMMCKVITKHLCNYRNSFYK